MFMCSCRRRVEQSKQNRKTMEAGSRRILKHFATFIILRFLHVLIIPSSCEAAVNLQVSPPAAFRGRDVADSSQAIVQSQSIIPHNILDHHDKDRFDSITNVVQNVYQQIAPRSAGYRGKGSRSKSAKSSKSSKKSKGSKGNSKASKSSSKSSSSSKSPDNDDKWIPKPPQRRPNHTGYSKLSSAKKIKRSESTHTREFERAIVSILKSSQKGTGESNDSAVRYSFDKLRRDVFAKLKIGEGDRTDKNRFEKALNVLEKQGKIIVFNNKIRLAMPDGRYADVGDEFAPVHNRVPQEYIFEIENVESADDVSGGEEYARNNDTHIVDENVNYKEIWDDTEELEDAVEEGIVRIENFAGDESNQRGGNSDGSEVLRNEANMQQQLAEVSDRSCGTGCIAGVAVGVVAGIAAIGGVLALVAKKKDAAFATVTSGRSEAVLV